MSADCHDYDDIIDLPRPVSRRHAPMPMANRAAQFSPFAALSGYEDAVEESARPTDARLELAEDAQAALDAQLALLPKACAAHIPVTVTYFVPDTHKEGGTYVTVTDTVKKMDEVERCLLLNRGDPIPFEDIYKIDYLG